MTDDTTPEQTPQAASAGDATPAEGEPAGEATGAEEAGAVATVTAPDVATEEHGSPPQSAFDRYVVPLVLPLAIIAVLVFYVLNVSRLFLASPDTGAVIMAVVITVAILAGAAALSAAPRMRSTSLRLVIAGFLFAVLLGGTLTIGASEEKTTETAGTLPADGPFLQSLDIDSFNIGFDPTQLETETGITKITLHNTQNGSHTFQFDDPTLAWTPLEVANQGDAPFGRVFIGESGDYSFFCAIPGHRAAGMEGTLTVTGDAKTLDQAQAELAGGGAGAETSTTAAG